MKLDKILGKLATILEVIAIFILIFKAKSMIVTTANWFEFMAIFTGLLIDLLYNKIKWEEERKMRNYKDNLIDSLNQVNSDLRNEKIHLASENSELKELLKKIDELVSRNQYNNEKNTVQMIRTVFHENKELIKD